MNTNKLQFKWLVLLFWLLVVVHLISILFDFSWLHGITKSLLIPALLLFFCVSRIKVPGRKLVAAGLFFSWFGDVFLLFESGNATFFIAGLVCFLITHVFYIRYFLITGDVSPSLLKKQPVWILMIICYGIGLVWVLFPYLGGLKIPVIIYAAVICSMLLCSIHIYLRVNRPANRYFVIGAGSFVLSDSLLAINKFYQPLPIAGIWIMLSYCAAQYFIVTAVICQEELRT